MESIVKSLRNDMEEHKLLKNFKILNFPILIHHDGITE